MANLRALGEVDVFPGAPADAFAVYPRLVARCLDVPIALVAFVNECSQFFPAATGLAEPWATRRQMPLSVSSCGLVVARDDDVVIADAPNEFGGRAFLGVPLRTPGGEPVGALCAVDVRAREWSTDDLATLRDLADAVMATIAVRVSEHRRAATASEVSHDLRTPLTRLRFELDDLGVETPHILELSSAVDELTRATRRGRVRDTDVELRALCRDVASQCETAAPVHVAGDTTAVRSVRAILHHVVALLVGAFDNGPLTLVASGDASTGRIALRADAASLDTSAIAAVRRLLVEQLGGRLLQAPSPDVAFEIVLPR